MAAAGGGFSGMSTQLESIFVVAAPPEAVVAAIRNPALIDESEKSRGALSVRVADVRRSDEAHEYEIFVSAPARSVKGIDSSKTEENRTHVVWDLPGKSGRWVWHGPHGPRVKVTGGYDVSSHSDGAELRLHAEIDIGLPVVGRVIEKKVSQGFESSWPNYVQIVRRFASETPVSP
jgi:hypothetical protein